MFKDEIQREGAKETRYDREESFVFIAEEKLLSHSLFRCQEVQNLPGGQAEHLLSCSRRVTSG